MNVLECFKKVSKKFRGIFVKRNKLRHLFPEMFFGFLEKMNKLRHFERTFLRIKDAWLQCATFVYSCKDKESFLDINWILRGKNYGAGL